MAMKVHANKNQFDHPSERSLCNLIRGVYAPLPKSDRIEEVTCKKCKRIMQGLKAVGRVRGTNDHG